MKKLVLSLLVASAFGLAAEAQVIGIYEGSSTTDISGTTVSVQATEYIYEGFFSAKNLTGTPIDVKIRRVSIVTPPSAVSEEVCVGPIPRDGSGYCYAIAPGSPNWLSPAENIVTLNATTYADMEVHVNPHGSLGTVHNRYYVEDVNGNKLDSVDLKIVNFLSVKEVKNNTVSFNAYPNPASENLVLTIQGTNGDNSFKLVDVLGKVVLEDKLGSTKKVDVSEFKNGVYILTVYSNGTLIQTRRVVVRH